MATQLTTTTSSPMLPRTPQSAPPAAPTPPATGTWQHPRMKEIERRREAAVFTNTKLVHTCIFVVALGLSFWTPGTWLRALLAISPVPAALESLIIAALRLILVFAASRSLQPFWAPVDEMTDIPLTPTQRKLLGLTPSSAPVTPGAGYVTPPRYARSTPRSESSRVAVHGSSPLGPGTPYSGSPLARKAMEGGRRFSASSSSLFDESKNGSPASPSASPFASPSGRGASVSLNSKWLYQRGKSRMSSGGVY